MRAEIRYLGFGFAIGASATALIVAAILTGVVPGLDAAAAGRGQSSQKALAPDVPPTSPVASSTTAITRLSISTSEPIATSTIVASPTATRTPDALESTINAGGLAFSGPLSNMQQVRLYLASLAYVQTTVADSIRESKQINGVGYGNPDTICGPLAIAILRDAGIIPPDTIPHDFWLLDPRTVIDQRKLEAVFPADQYEHTKVTTPLNKVDWRATPLQPGDFVFIWHGSGGNFDHMLVVNRVDKDNRAYSVTNYGTPDGFIIGETLLYDPTDPTQGIFHTWTKVRLAILGSTGFGGYELWRQRTP